MLYDTIFRDYDDSFFYYVDTIRNGRKFGEKERVMEIFKKERSKTV